MRTQVARGPRSRTAPGPPPPLMLPARTGSALALAGIIDVAPRQPARCRATRRLRTFRRQHHADQIRRSQEPQHKCIPTKDSNRYQRRSDQPLWTDDDLDLHSEPRRPPRPIASASDRGGVPVDDDDSDCELMQDAQSAPRRQRLRPGRSEPRPSARARSRRHEYGARVRLRLLLGLGWGRRARRRRTGPADRIHQSRAHSARTTHDMAAQEDQQREPGR